MRDYLTRPFGIVGDTRGYSGSQARPFASLRVTVQYSTGDLDMSLKGMLAGTAHWLRSRRFAALRRGEPQIDDDGLLVDVIESEQPAKTPIEAIAPHRRAVPEPVQPLRRPEPVVRLQEDFDKLLGQLQTINDNLDRQLAQQADLADRIEELPELFERFPRVVEEQSRVAGELLEEVKLNTAKHEQFVNAIERMPEEAVKQTSALGAISRQLGRTAKVDAQMVKSLRKFDEVLNRLNQSTASNTEGILQMSRMFAASERYLRYVMSRQHNRFVWLFAATVAVCMTVILILAGLIMYLGR